MLLYADKDFPLPVVEELRRLGHDVITAQEDGRRHTADVDLLSRAHLLGRAVLTHNRRDYERLDRQGAAHSGILSATQDPNRHAALAARIGAALSGRSPGRWCVRVNRPPALRKKEGPLNEIKAKVKPWRRHRRSETAATLFGFSLFRGCMILCTQ
jgi:hypothetical protein